MAHFFPALETITELRQKPTAGELHLLHLLKDALDDSYEIYFQPYLNGDIPDIIVMRKGSGIYVFEVKDWNLDAYQIELDLDWSLRSNSKVRLVSPINQVNSYKDQLFKLHIPGLYAEKIWNKNLYAIVNCGVYFHKHESSVCEGFIMSVPDSLDKAKLRWYKNQLDYTDVIGADLDSEKILKIMTRRRMDKPSFLLFGVDLYERFKRQLNPSTAYHPSRVSPFNYSKRTSQSHRKQKSGSRHEGQRRGWKRKNNVPCENGLSMPTFAPRIRVLILTFNITLRNYIHVTKSMRFAKASAGNISTSSTTTSSSRAKLEMRRPLFAAHLGRFRQSLNFSLRFAGNLPKYSS